MVMRLASSHTFVAADQHPPPEGKVYVMTQVEDSKYPREAMISEGNWVAHLSVKPVLAIAMNQEFRVQHEHELLVGQPGDYLVQLVDGRYDVIDGDLFRSTHEQMVAH